MENLKDETEQQPLLLNSNDSKESGNSDLKTAQTNTFNQTYHQKDLHDSWSWKRLSLTTLFVTILALFVAIIFYSVPKLVQNTLDNSHMIIINGTIYNPTNSSLTMNTTIMVSNTGFLNGKLKSTKATVMNNGIIFGEMYLPSLSTVANKITFVKMSSVLQITNPKQFQISCKNLLHNNDQKWQLLANKTILTVDTVIFGKINFFVNLNKELTLKGTNLYNFIASDITVDSATKYTLTSFSNLNFISDSVFTFILPNVVMNLYYDKKYFGHAPITSLLIKPGLNTIANQPLIIEKYAEMNNQQSLNKFISKYIAGESQQIEMKGPNASHGTHTVIDNTLSERIIALGYPNGDLAFGGVVTRASQQGWKVGDKTVRGAYSNFVNPLGVPMRIVNMSIISSLPETLRYHVQLVKHLGEYDCEERVFAHLHIGQGIYKNDPSKTWIDVAANGKTTIFTIASPPKGSKPANCMYAYDFSCCFATLTTAYACKLNPDLQKKASLLSLQAYTRNNGLTLYNGELSTAYMPMQLDGNMSILIDNAFKVDTVYKQDFFPLYFGYEIYAGYAGNLELSCNSFTFK